MFFYVLDNYFFRKNVFKGKKLKKVVHFFHFSTGGGGGITISPFL